MEFILEWGSFAIPQNTEQIKESDALYFRLPISWYIEAIKQIRLQLGTDIKVIIFSDGKPYQLADVLKLNNVALSKTNSAISDLITLSKASVIVASGSTFSMWAAYLGQKPSIWFPSTRRGNLIESDKDYIYQPEWESGKFSDLFINKILQKYVER